MLDVNYSKCSGCGLCMQICPKKCIKMVEDEKGFVYPKVLKPNDCINCNLCNKMCPMNKQLKKNERKYYALQLKDRIILNNCASGGAFTTLAMYVIDNGGIVCGVSKNDEKLKFIFVHDKSDLMYIQGSKYFQCDLKEDVYNKINELNSNIYFLFSGTPCQVAAIEEKYRRKFKDKLITVEIICQGVPSYKVVSKAYKELEQKNNSKIVKHIFRSKDNYVEKDYLNKYTYSDGKVEYVVGSDDILTKSFKTQIFLRNSCYKCNFAQNNRVSDFTIGDLWDYNLKNKNIQKKKGVSVVIANNCRVINILNECEKYSYIEVINSDCVDGNIPFNNPVKKPFARNFSYKLLNTKLSFKIVTNICCVKYNIKQLIKKIIKK